MLSPGFEIKALDREGKDAGTFVVRGLRAHGGQGYVYTLAGPDKRPAVLKVPGPKGVFSNEIEVRILKNLPPHKNVIRLCGTTYLQGVECAIFGWGHPNPYQRLNATNVMRVTKRFRGVAPKTPLPATTAVELVQEVLAALEHVHRYSYVHGDLKPANVLVELNTTKTRVTNREFFAAIQQRAYTTILADFGSARSLQFLAEQTAQGKQIAPSEFTPVFAPPEIFDRDRDHSGLGVDVYQVGLFLYQLITGHLPYDHAAPRVARAGLTRELVDVKKGELAGKLRAYDPARLRAARHQDVVFAEAFASQRMRDRFFEDVERVVDLATTPDPASRPTISQLRAEFFRLFELEPPVRGPNRQRAQVSVWNPRWHLTRDNRLAVAARVPDPQERQPAPETVRTQRVDGPETVGDTAADEALTEPITAADPPRRGASRRAELRTQPLDGLPTERDAPRRPSGRDRLSTQPVEAGDGPATQPLDEEDLRSIRFTRMYRQVTEDSPAAPPAAPRPAWERPGAPPPRPRAAAAPPREPALPPAVEVDAPEDEQDPVVGMRVALVDDDRVALAVLGRALRKRGCEVRTFQDPEAALESISRDSPDAAVVDMQMPGISGIDLLRRLSRRLNGLPFPLLILSSVEEEQVLKEAFRHGARDYLIKPVTEAELAVKLEKAVREHAEERPQGVPRELGGFELLEELRRGEVAIVYRAADVWDRYPDVVKAIKVLRPDLVGEAEPLLKLRREVDILADCEHPGLVRVHEAGLVGRFFYYVAEELPPRTLGQEVREAGPLPAAQVEALLREGADALAHLHEQHILVGDLSPEGLGRLDGGRLMICELGNARRLGPVLRLDEPEIPRSRYGPPELFDDPPQLDLRADLYSLGVCALEAYTGKPAVRSRTTGAIEVGPLTQGLPPALGTILSRMVAPDPKDRFPHAVALSQELQRVGARR